MKNISISNIIKKKKIVCLTAYTTPIAILADKFSDIILVGDSLGPVLYGFKTTREVTLEMMINHAKAVVNSVKNSIVVVDMPYGSYEDSKFLALKNAKRIIEMSGADAVKVEGGKEVAETIKYLTENNIKVMGHLGMLPQQIKGKPSVYGRKILEKYKILEDLKSIEDSGVFAVVVECTLESVVRNLLEINKVPIIGIGASKMCDGQILVTEDILGMTTFKSKFLKKYMNFNDKAKLALLKYYKDVKNGKYPTKKYCYK